MDMMSLRRRVMVNQNKLMTATGNPITFNTPLTKPLKECVVRFTPTQEGSGTPSPENVREIVGKNSVSVWVSGKNILNPNDADWGQYTINSTGGHIEETDRICSGYIPCNEGDTYTFSGSVMGSLSYVMSFVGIAGFDKDKAYVSRSIANHVSAISYTVPNGVKYIRVFEEAPKYPNITMAIWGNTLKRQLEIGSTATEYEPFTGVETSVSFDDAPQDVDPSEVAGTIYGGYVDISKGELVAEWRKVDMGDLKWGITWNTFNTAPSDHANNDVGGTPAEIMCDIYPSDINTSTTGVGVINKNIRGRANYKHICIRDDDYTTAEDFKTAVTGHYLTYKLAEPIHYPIPTHILTTLRGSNVMWSDANGDITIKYWTR